jgi:hypothetical protein
MQKTMKKHLQNTVQKAKALLFGIIKGKRAGKLTLIFIGLTSTLWFLIRVIPKPGRAAYPCMRAAAPLASSFILYLIGISGSMFLFKKAKERFRQSKYVLTLLFIIVGLVVGTTVTLKYSNPAKASTVSKLEPPNSPMGIGKGIFPGRVVWVHNPDATNENATNTSGDYWWDDKNTDQEVVNSMLAAGVQGLTGTKDNQTAWDSIFHYFNRTHGNGNAGYTAGEKIVIKINLNGAGNGPQNINTSPQICYAVLNHLVNVAGVAQADISIGDPRINFTAETWNKCHSAFPDVNYWGYSSGRTEVEVASSDPVITSDGSVEDLLPQAYLDAKYMINMPVFKKHHRAGVSLTAKNHFGSLNPFLGGNAFHLHYSLPCSVTDGIPDNGDYGAYRCFVDIMGHKHLGGKTILYLVDGIWGSTNWGHPPVKWFMSPFNNDWPSSLFLSQDQVAIESVGFDFLFNEFDESHPTEGLPMNGNTGPYPRFPGTDDYMHQAADPANWPVDIQYDPEGDGTILTSLGTHEHWNNPTDKKYTRNLGTGAGIELFKAETSTSVQENNLNNNGFTLMPNFPNPFKSSTTISYYLPSSAVVLLETYNINGQLIRTLVNSTQPAGEHKVTWDGKIDNGSSAKPGHYICKLSIKGSNFSCQLSNKILLIN